MSGPKYIAGRKLTFSITVKVRGTLTDPTAARFWPVSPSGRSLLPTPYTWTIGASNGITRDDTGTFHVDWQSSAECEIGQHFGHWEFDGLDGAPTQMTDDPFELIASEAT